MGERNRAWLKRDVVEQHSVDMRQFVDLRPVTLSNGMRAVEGYNSSGLTFTILLDRGLDIWTAHYNGLPLTWISQGSPHLPDYGQSWLRQFNGGLLATCGLSHVGPPETDANTGEFRDLHGRFNRLRAQDACIRRGWIGDRYEVELSATVHESRFFGEQLRLERTVRLVLGQPALEINDRITNLGDSPAPLMLLYHFNVGYPLVSKGAELITPYESVLPRDDSARAGLPRWAHYDAPVAGYAEEVFFHHLKQAASSDPQARQLTEVALVNRTIGVSLAWDTTTLPYLTQWKNTRQGVYVCGIEPGNCIPEGQAVARKQGRLHTIQPGESTATNCTLTILDGSEAVNECRARILFLQQTGRLIAGCYLGDYVAQ